MNRLTKERERGIEVFRQTGAYLVASKALLRTAYGSHASVLLAEIDALRQERDLAIGALRSLWDVMPKDAEMPLKVAASVMFVLEHSKEEGEG